MKDMSPEKQQIPILEDVFRIPENPKEEPYLIGSKCPQCMYVAFPVKRVCPSCFNRKGIEHVPLSRRGKIHTFAICQVGPPEYKVPYVIGYVDLPEGTRIFAQITGVEPEEKALKTGDEVELVFGKMYEDDKGNEVIGYRFHKV